MSIAILPLDRLQNKNKLNETRKMFEAFMYVSFEAYPRGVY